MSTRSIRTLVIGTLLALCIVESAVLINDFKEISFTHDLKPHQSQSVHLEPWMTFAYVNTLYHLDPTFLQTVLGIADDRYPNIEIRKFARDRQTDLDTLLSDLSMVISRELAP